MEHKHQEAEHAREIQMFQVLGQMLAEFLLWHHKGHNLYQ